MHRIDEEGGSILGDGRFYIRQVVVVGWKQASCYYHSIYWSKQDTYLTDNGEVANILQLLTEGSAKMTLRMVLI